MDVLFVHGNPIYELPVAAGFAEAMAKVPFVVSFSSMVDETGVQADLTLPNNSYLETWGYQVVTPPGDRPASAASSRWSARSTTPRHDRCAPGSGAAVGGVVKEALPWQNTVEFMKADWPSWSAGCAVQTKTADAVWAGCRQYGGWWPQRRRPPCRPAPVVPAALRCLGRLHRLPRNSRSCCTPTPPPC